jgi:hypothetical protein
MTTAIFVDDSWKPQAAPRRRAYGVIRPHRRRALEFLAGSPTGCTETLLFAYGIGVDTLVELVRAGLATAQSERMVASGKPMEIARGAGRRVLAGDANMRRCGTQ